MRSLINAYKKLLSLKKVLISSPALIALGSATQPQLVKANKTVTNQIINKQKPGNKAAANLESHSIQTRTEVEESQPKSASDNNSNNIRPHFLMIVLTRLPLISLILPLNKIRYMLATLKDGSPLLTKPRNC